MVQEYNTSASNQGIPESEMKAYIGNLIPTSTSSSESEELEGFSGPEFHDFDVAAIGMGFHHFTDPPLAAKRLAERLKTGGVLFILDFLPHGPGEGTGHGHGHGHGHHHHAHGDKGSGSGNGGDNLDGKYAGAAETVIHHGFSEGAVKKMFVEAGVGKNFGFEKMGKGVVFTNEGQEMKRSVFMARGFKE
jgi:SAM-dependent methyltransferase